jgi:hypothetical protein
MPVGVYRGEMHLVLTIVQPQSHFAEPSKPVHRIAQQALASVVGGQQQRLGVTNFREPPWSFPNEPDGMGIMTCRDCSGGWQS